MTKTKDMNRTELIYELARHAHPSWYHSLLEWPTEQLRGLVAYYRDETKTIPAGRIYRTKGLGDTPEPQNVLTVGIDWGKAAIPLPASVQRLLDLPIGIVRSSRPNPDKREGGYIVTVDLIPQPVRRLHVKRA